MGENSLKEVKIYNINGRGYYMPPFGIMQLSIIQQLTTQLTKDGNNIRFSEVLTPENIAKLLSYVLASEGKSWTVESQKAIEMDMLNSNVETELVIDILNDFFGQNPKLMKYFESVFGILGLLMTASKQQNR